jgi:hypothetical protein
MLTPRLSQFPWFFTFSPYSKSDTAQSDTAQSGSAQPVLDLKQIVECEWNL